MGGAQRTATKTFSWIRILYLPDVVRSGGSRARDVGWHYEDVFVDSNSPPLFRTLFVLAALALAMWAGASWVSGLGLESASERVSPAVWRQHLQDPYNHPRFTFHHRAASGRRLVGG